MSEKGPVTNYSRGYNFENRLVNALKKAGIYAIRTAGSHGVFDVVGLDNKWLYLIQAKSFITRQGGYLEDSERLGSLTVPPYTRKWMMVWQVGRGLVSWTAVVPGGIKPIYTPLMSFQPSGWHWVDEDTYRSLTSSLVSRRSLTRT